MNDMGPLPTEMPGLISDRLAAVEAERDRLLLAIKTHHAQKADDRCIEDDDRLYEAARLPPCDRRVGDKLAMVKNCIRFIENRCQSGGWLSYAQLELQLKHTLEGQTVYQNRCVHLADFIGMLIRRGIWAQDRTLGEVASRAGQCGTLQASLMCYLDAAAFKGNWSMDLAPLPTEIVGCILEAIHTTNHSTPAKTGQQNQEQNPDVSV